MHVSEIKYIDEKDVSSVLYELTSNYLKNV